jgi:hypothetical protein
MRNGKLAKKSKLRSHTSAAAVTCYVTLRLSIVWEYGQTCYSRKQRWFQPLRPSWFSILHGNTTPWILITLSHIVGRRFLNYISTKYSHFFTSNFSTLIHERPVYLISSVQSKKYLLCLPQAIAWQMFGPFSFVLSTSAPVKWLELQNNENQHIRVKIQPFYHWQPNYKFFPRCSHTWELAPIFGA